MALCDRNAHCMFLKDDNDYKCRCKDGYEGDGTHGNCRDKCNDFCRNEGICGKVITISLCFNLNLYNVCIRFIKA